MYFSETDPKFCTPEHLQTPENDSYIVYLPDSIEDAVYGISEHYALLDLPESYFGGLLAVKAKIGELLQERRDRVCGVLTMSDNAYDSAILIRGGGSNREYARNLFASLREFDRLGAEVVFAEFEAQDGYALAVRNRLYKAAAQRIIRV